MKILDVYSEEVWEQRRYEIAKDILATSHIAQQIGQYGYHCEEEVKEAVRMADLLIAELKKKEWAMKALRLIQATLHNKSTFFNDQV